MALYPDQFLAGLDREQEGFGHQAGLKEWLALCDRGLMDTGIKPIGEIREAFETALATHFAN